MNPRLEGQSEDAVPLYMTEPKGLGSSSRLALSASRPRFESSLGLAGAAGAAQVAAGLSGS